MPSQTPKVKSDKNYSYGKKNFIYSKISVNSPYCYFFCRLQAQFKKIQLKLLKESANSHLLALLYRNPAQLANVKEKIQNLTANQSGGILKVRTNENEEVLINLANGSAEIPCHPKTRWQNQAAVIPTAVDQVFQKPNPRRRVFPRPKKSAEVLRKSCQFRRRQLWQMAGNCRHPTGHLKAL